MARQSSFCVCFATTCPAGPRDSTLPLGRPVALPMAGWLPCAVLKESRHRLERLDKRYHTANPTDDDDGIGRVLGGLALVLHTHAAATRWSWTVSSASSARHRDGLL